MGWGNPGERVQSRCGRAPEHRNRDSSRISSRTKRATRPCGIFIQVGPGIRVESRERSGCTHPLRDWTRQAGQGFRALGQKTSAVPGPEVPGPGVPLPPELHPPRDPSRPCREPPGSETDEEPEMGVGRPAPSGLGGGAKTSRRKGRWGEGGEGREEKAERDVGRRRSGRWVEGGVGGG